MVEVGGQVIRQESNRPPASAFLPQFPSSNTNNVRFLSSVYLRCQNCQYKDRRWNIETPQAESAHTSGSFIFNFLKIRVLFLCVLVLDSFLST